jgi:DNA transformation protein
MDKLAAPHANRRMSESAADLAFARELFAAIGPVEVKRMFGGAGVWAGGAMFALIDDGRIYLKTDATLASVLAAEGAVPWIYTGRGEAQVSSYLSLPDSALDDAEEACAWGRRALAVAEAKKAAAKPKRRR